MAENTSDILPGDWAVLCALASGASHGFAASRLLAPDGALGRIWTVHRAAVYQSLKRLTEHGYVREGPTRPSERGQETTFVKLNAAGLRHLEAWLSEPVQHVRDVRSMLLLKLALLDCTGADPRPLLIAQRDRVRPQVQALQNAREDAEDFDRVLLEWRLASSAATLHFLDTLLASD